MKYITKSAQAKAEREARKQEWLDKKAREALELADLRRRAQALIARLPPEYQDWGVIKTRGFVRLQAFTRRRAALKRPKLPVLRECVSKLEQA